MQARGCVPNARRARPLERCGSRCVAGVAVERRRARREPGRLQRQRQCRTYRNSQAGDPATLDFPIFYVKRSVPDATRAATWCRTTCASCATRCRRPISTCARRPHRAPPRPTSPPASPSAPPTTSRTWTSPPTAPGGVRHARPAGRQPADQEAAVAGASGSTSSPPTRWRPVINPASDPDPDTVNDVSPHYLPDGRIVFSSTRQTQSQGVLLDEQQAQFSALDEARVENPHSCSRS